jgi:hypothetical protein
MGTLDEIAEGDVSNICLCVLSFRTYPQRLPLPNQNQQPVSPGHGETPRDQVSPTFTAGTEPTQSNDRRCRRIVSTCGAGNVDGRHADTEIDTDGSTAKNGHGRDAL